MSCVWLFIVYIYNYVQHNGECLTSKVELDFLVPTVLSVMVGTWATNVTKSAAWRDEFLGIYFCGLLTIPLVIQRTGFHHFASWVWPFFRQQTALTPE